MSITAGINAELIQWFAELPVWYSVAFRTLLSKPALDNHDLDQVLACARAELGLESSTTLPARLSDAELPTAPTQTGAEVRLTAVHTLTKVNMLESTQRLTIGPSLTLVYGANGAGKSGYARVLKSACRCHEAATEGILPNVYQATAPSGKPSATFEISVAGTGQTVNWQAGTTAVVLRNFVVFDSKAARSYLTERNSVSAVPPVLAKLELLGAVVKAVKDRLAGEATGVQPAASELQQFVDGTTTGKLLGSLTTGLPHQALEDALSWTDADQAQLTDLRQQEAKMKAEGPQALRRQLTLRRGRLATLRNALAGAEQVVGDAAVEAIRTQHQLCRELREQKAAAATQVLSSAVVAGTGSATWDALIRAAAEFFASEVKPGQIFPGSQESAYCVLCHQALTSEAHERLDRFWHFLQNDISRRLITAEKELRRLVAASERVSGDLPPDVAGLADTLKDDVPSIWAKIPEHLAALAARRAALVAAANNGGWSAMPMVPASLAELCTAEDRVLEQREKALADVATAQAELAKITAQVNDLGARQRAAGSRTFILDYHRRLVRAGKLRAAANQVSTQGVSTKCSQLQKKHVTKAFEVAVQEHARDLGLQRAVPGISLQTEYGKTTQSVQIEGAKLSGVRPAEVFSEGEQVALALAYFFAEHSDAASAPALIFDDPVTSLSHRIRAKVIQKLVAFAGNRQVIVFTHDLSFYCGLKDAATRASVPLQLRSIEAFANRVGIVREGEPLDAMSVAEREQLLGELLKEAKAKEAAADGQGLAAATARFYSVKRATWERAVEELLFNKVVMRFDEAVKTQSLTGAVVDQATIAKIFAAMTKCSGCIDGHDHAVAANVALPDTAEMAKDLQDLRNFRVEQKAKIQAQQLALKHLKS